MSFVFDIRRVLGGFALIFISVLSPVHAETYVEISTGGNHSCALLASGSVQCCGFNNSGQLGNGTTTNSGTPVAVSRITTATSVSAGGSHSCARLNSGQLRCWGANSRGQLGDGLGSLSQVVPQHVGAFRCVLDLDGDGQFATTTDGLLLARAGRVVRYSGYARRTGCRSNPNVLVSDSDLP